MTATHEHHRCGRTSNAPSCRPRSRRIGPRTHTSVHVFTQAVLALEHTRVHGRTCDHTRRLGAPDLVALALGAVVVDKAHVARHIEELATRNGDSYDNCS